MKTLFPITSLSREDFAELGFDASNVSDDAMQRMAEQMADAFCDCCYWQTLDYLADQFHLPRNDT